MTFYGHRYKKIHCIVVRGAHFCPSAVNALSSYLGVTKNNMIMGVPDASFPFPFATLRGVRLAINAADQATVTKSLIHFKNVLAKTYITGEMGGGGRDSNGNSDHGHNTPLFGRNQPSRDGPDEDGDDLSKEGENTFYNATELHDRLGVEMVSLQDLQTGTAGEENKSVAGDEEQGDDTAGALPMHVVTRNRIYSLLDISV